MIRTFTVDAWIQVVPEIGQNFYNEGEVIGAKAVRMGQRRPKPDNRIPGSMLTRIRLRIPQVVFDPIIDALVDIDPALADVTVTQGEI